MGSAFMCLICLVIPLVFVIPIIMGIWVYKDAKRGVKMGCCG